MEMNLIDTVRLFRLHFFFLSPESIIDEPREQKKNKPKVIFSQSMQRWRSKFWGNLNQKNVKQKTTTKMETVFFDSIIRSNFSLNLFQFFSTEPKRPKNLPSFTIYIWVINFYSNFIIIIIICIWSDELI